MKTFVLALPASEVVHLLRAETKASLGAPELDTGAEKDYIIEEDFDRDAYGIVDGKDYDLVTSIATLSIEPRVEHGYWILETVVERVLGPMPVSEEDELAYTELTLDEFDKELRAPGRKRVSVRLHVETAAIREEFNRWLGEMRARHPWQIPGGEGGAETGQEAEQASRMQTATGAAMGAYRAREAVGVFGDPDVLEAAVDELEVSGFNRAAISVLGTDTKARDYIGRFYQTVREVEDSSRAPRGEFVSRDESTEEQAAAIGVPLYVGGFAGAAAVAAAGGVLALAVAATIAGAAVGAGLGALLAAAIARRHAAQVKEQLRKGGLVLWVGVPDAEAEKRATAILERMGARDVHVHEIHPEWSLSDMPVTVAQFDPFLESDRR